MGLHPAERVREYRDKGYWNDDMIDALLRERVRAHGDIPAIVDPLNRDALMDGPFRVLTWPQLDEQVLPAGAGAAGRRASRPATWSASSCPTRSRSPSAFLAIVRIGAIVAPFPVQYRAYELTHLSQRRPGPSCSSRPSRIGHAAGRRGDRRAAGQHPVTARGGRVRPGLPDGRRRAR